jgi:hypothetical protein
MDETSARARIEMLTAATELPVLTATDLNVLVDLARDPDASGREPSDAAWEPTWDITRAVYWGWRTKAGRVAGHWSFSADGQSIDKAAVLANIERMVMQYAPAGDVSVMPVGLTVDPSDYVIGS